MTTNYERIKNMNFEEMLEFLDKGCSKCTCIYSQDDCDGKRCVDGIKQWLNQEVEE